VKRDLEALTAREHDLLVVGGGIHGAAAAWDAAQRGLAVALVERRDFGSGTSWNSLKTIHGGLRHLQRLDLAGVRESIRERRALLRIAPDLVRPLPFLVPLRGHGLQGREAFAVGLRLYDILGLDRNRGVASDRQIPAGRILSRRDVLARVPGLSGDRLAGGALWHDAQVVSSERLLLAFLHAASAAGAVLANDAEVVGWLRAGSRVTGARVRDGETGIERDVPARLVLNAAGPGAGPLLRLAGIERPAIPLLRAVNLVLGRAVVTEAAVGGWSAGRLLFVVPWRDRSIVGTGYFEAEIDVVSAAAAFFDDARRAFPFTRLDVEDVTLVHQGLVPGRDGGASLWTRSRLIDHGKEDGVPGLLTMVGVKYTTARALAEEAVDVVVARLGRRLPPCRTSLTLLAATRPPGATLEDQVRNAVREEMARRLTDVVLRRLDLGTAGPPETATVDTVARVLAAERGRDEAWIEAERQDLAAVYEPAVRIADRMTGRR
jgi:glycerol-3-phosphate dehydrogenase